MDLKSVLKIFYFVIVGLVASFLLIFISEKIKFSHINLLPFGGQSWAIWFYPLIIGICFGISAIIFKLKKPFLILLLAILICFGIFYFIFKDYLFINYMPFNI